MNRLQRALIGVLIYIAVASSIYILVQALYGLEEGIIIVFPFFVSPYIPSEVNPFVFMGLVVASSAIMLIAAYYLADKFPVASFLLGLTVFSNTVVVFLFKISKGPEIAIGLPPVSMLNAVINMLSDKIEFVGMLILLGILFTTLAQDVMARTSAKVRLLVGGYTIRDPLIGLLAMTMVIVIHESGHAITALLMGYDVKALGVLYPIGAFVEVEGQLSPFAGAVIAQAGNLAVVLFMLASEPYRERFWKAFRYLGAQITLLNAIPAFAIVITQAFIAIGLVPFTDGSMTFILANGNPDAILAGLILMLFNVYVSVRELYLLGVGAETTRKPYYFFT